MDATAQRGIFRDNSLVALGTLGSRVTGLLRVAAVAVALGNGAIADVYTLANVSPNLIYELLIGGVLSATLVPILVQAHQDEDRKGPDALMTVGMVAVSALTLVAIAGAPLVAGIFGETSGESRDLMIGLLHLILPQIFFYGLTTLATAALHSRRSFLAPAYTPIVNNLVVIAVMGVVWALPLEPTTVFQLVLGLGTTAGIAAMALLLLPAMDRAGIVFGWNFDLRDPLVRKVVRLSGWTVGYVVANQVALTVVLRLARGGDDGDVFAYTNAFTYFQLPHGLIAVTVMTTFLPGLAAASSAKRLDDYRSEFAGGARLMLTGTIPAAGAYIIIATAVTQVVFLTVGDRFTEAGAILTGDTLAAFAVGLPAFSVYLFALRGFYARQDTRTPFIINVGENALNIVLALILAGSGPVGLAWAYSISYLCGAVVAVTMLGRDIGGYSTDEVRRTVRLVVQVTIATGLMMAVMAMARSGLGNDGVGESFRLLLISLPLGLMTFVGAAMAMKIEYVDVAWAAIERRRRRPRS